MSQEESQILFTLSTTSLSHLSNVLGSISPVGSKSSVIINEKGLFFVINDINICKVQLNLDSNFFDSFEFNNPLPSSLENDDPDAPNNKNVRFGIDIHSLLESVTIANSYNSPYNTGLQQQQQQQQPLKTNCILSYRGYGYPFVLSFEDEMMLERVEFQTFNIEDEDEDETFFEVDNDRLILEIILKGSILYEILKDLKEIQTEQIYIYCDTKNDVPTLIFISKGELGYSKLMFPRKKSLLEEMVIHKMVRLQASNDQGFSFPKDEEYEYVKSNQDSITSFYNFSYFSKFLRLAKLAYKVKFKKDSNGLTSITLLVKDEAYNGSRRNSSSTTVIEFKLLEFVNPYSHDQDGTNVMMNHNFNNSYIQNLIEDDDVIELEFNAASDNQQQQIDTFLRPLQPRNDYRNALDEDTQTGNRVSILDKLERLNTNNENNDNILANSTFRNNASVSGSIDNGNDRGKKKRKVDDQNNGIDVVGGAIEHPIFL